MRFSILTAAAAASISGVLAAPQVYFNATKTGNVTPSTPSMPKVAVAAAAAAPAAPQAAAVPRVGQAKEMVTALKADVEGDLADMKSGDVTKMKSRINTVTTKVDSVSSMVASILNDVDLGGLSEQDKSAVLGMFKEAKDLASEVEDSMGSINPDNRAVLQPELDVLRVDLGALLGPLLNVLLGLLGGLLGGAKPDSNGKPSGEKGGLLGNLLGGLLGGLGLDGIL
ncbi:uncharacterized protein PgNI_00674 [Pyricularia grisea]|uniref:Uncharacterized protein n=1 Tax=Pyricularia grisea TaxID=148305 RepID=A0A6P8BM13_PYRGI|nr:uncharacterized protein PgNI_00674 [Pyricularia grisea]TLD17853.1 hypothetical protein PgNI_00674 [Pyricularia grisea]